MAACAGAAMVAGCASGAGYHAPLQFDLRGPISPAAATVLAPSESPRVYADNPAVARFLQEHGGLRTQPFTVTRFVLLSARPGWGGPPYAVEADYPFDGASDWADDATLEQDRF